MEQHFQADRSAKRVEAALSELCFPAEKRENQTQRLERY